VSFGGWNVRSCFHFAKQQLIIKQLLKYKIQIAALCETGLYDSGIKQIGDYTLIYSGMSSVKKTRSAHGVGVCLDKTATSVWKTSGSEWEAVDERIIKVRLSCTPITVTFIAVYAPVNPSNLTMIQASERFYTGLQETIDRVPKGDMIILMGDFNARIGQQQRQLTAFRNVGPYTVDMINDNGERLVDFCTVNNVVVTNTFYEHKAVYQTSWMHPGTKKWHLLDYTLVNRKFRSSVEDVRFYRKAAGSVGTDHHLMRAKIKLHLKSRRKGIQSSHFRLDHSKLKDDRILENFQKDVARKFEDDKDRDLNINEKYDTFVHALKKAANQHLNLDKKNIRKKKEWMTNEILEAVDKKSSVYLDWQNYRGSNVENRYRNRYIKMRKLVKTLCDKRKVEYSDELSEEIEIAVKQHDPATAYAMIRRLKGGRQKVENMPIFDKHDSLLLNSKDRLKRWR
jgi:exonuclease III